MAILDTIKSKFSSEEKYQKFVRYSLFGIGVIIVVIFVIITIHAQNSSKKKKKTKGVKYVSLVNKNKFQKEQWILSAQKKINVQSSELAKVKKQNSRLAKDVHDLVVLEQNKKKRRLANNKINNHNAKFNPAIPGLPSSNYNNPPVPSGRYGAKQVKTTIIPVTNPINVILNSEPQKNKKKTVKKKAEAKSFFLPAGTITEGLLINGMDAPASMKGKSNPYPALIRLTNLSFLPNQYRSSIKGCFVIAEGYGSLSSERVYLRTTDLSCIVKGGRKHINVPIHAYVVGAHGKVGLRGKVVTKQGAILAREFVAGMVQGFANITTQESSTLDTSALGTTSSINPADMGEAGLGSGLGTAAQELSKFYMKMANSMTPVVVIGGGRKLTMVLSQGAWISFKNNIKLAKNINSLKKERKK